MAVVLFSESRRANSDGSYTDQKVFKVEASTLAAIVNLGHDLERIPDWVRVTALALCVRDAPEVATPAYLDPVIESSTGVDERFEWNDNGGTVVLSDHIRFAAFNDTQFDAYFLVEFGITHSKTK